MNSSPDALSPRPAAPFARRVVAIAAAGFLLRLAAVLWVPTAPVSDFWSYYHRGLNLAEHGRYEAAPGRVDANYPPLYPILLAGVFLIAPGHTLLAAKILNCVLGAAAILIAAALTRRLWGERAGTAAAVLLAGFPRAILLPCLIASENLFSPLLLLFIFLVLEAARSPKAWRLAAGAGAILALAALTRTVAYYLGALWLLGALAGRKRLGRALAETLLLVVVQHAAMLPWALRNEAALRRFTFLNTAGGYATFLGNNPNATGLWYDGRAELEKLAPGVLAKGELAISDASNALAWRWIRENRTAALRLYFVKIGVIFRQADLIETFAVSGTDIRPPVPGLDALPGPHPLKAHLPALKTALSSTAWLLTALAMGGWIVLGTRVWRTRAPADLSAALVLPAAALYVPVTSALIAVNGRYRWPVEDVMVPAAAFLIAWLPEGFRKARGSAPARWRPEPSRASRVLEVATLAIAAGILTYQLFVPPVVGLADNGDFSRVLAPVGLEHRREAEPRAFRFLELRYDTRAPRSSGSLSSEIPIAAAARVLGAAFPPKGGFDLRVLGALHFVLRLAGLALLVLGSRGWRPLTRVAFAAGLVFVFTDVGYAAPLNSFYAAAASQLSLVVLAGVVLCLAAGWSSGTLEAAYWIAALGLVLSKPQEVVLAPWVAVLAILLARRGRGPGSLRAARWLGALACAAAFLWYRMTPVTLKAVALYDNVFIEILPKSSDPAADLRELGLPEAWARFGHVFPFAPESPLFEREFQTRLLATVGYRRLAAFYARHPERLLERFREGAERAAELRPSQLGNFTLESGARPFQRSHAFEAWSDARARLAPAFPLLLPIFWMVHAVAAIAVARRARRPSAQCLAVAVLVLTLASVTEFAVCLMGDALHDLSRHLFLFDSLVDLLLVADLTLIVSGLAALARRRHASPVAAPDPIPAA